MGLADVVHWNHFEAKSARGLAQERRLALKRGAERKSVSRTLNNILTVHAKEVAPFEHMFSPCRVSKPFRKMAKKGSPREGSTWPACTRCLMSGNGRNVWIQALMQGRLFGQSPPADPCTPRSCLEEAGRGLPPSTRLAGPAPDPRAMGVVGNCGCLKTWLDGTKRQTRMELRISGEISVIKEEEANGSLVLVSGNPTATRRICPWSLCSIYEPGRFH